MPFDRRRLLQLGGGAAVSAGLPALDACTKPATRADYARRLRDPHRNRRYRTGAGRHRSTTTCNGQYPGPLLRFREGGPAVVDIHNDTPVPEQVHWHGQKLPVDVDGAAEEGKPSIPAHGSRRIAFTPGPAGFRFYQSYLIAGGDLTAGQYSGQSGPVYIEPRHEPGRYDREVLITLKEFSPTLSKAATWTWISCLPPP